MPRRFRILDSAGLPELHLLAPEIADDLRSALVQIEDARGEREVIHPGSNIFRWVEVAPSALFDS